MDHRVLLVERDRLMLEQLAQTVRAAQGFTLVARYQSPLDALGQGVVFHPDVILLDVEEADAAQLIESFCRTYPEAKVFCLDEVWRADAAARLVQAGAAGYLVKPFTAVELYEAVSSAGEGASECTTVAFFSPKGKSGKTTLIANLALVLAARTGARVGIIDADLQFGDMALFFNISPPSTIVEAVRDIRDLAPATLAPYFAPVSPLVSVLCGTKSPNLIDKVSIDGFERLVRMAQENFSFLLIDVPPGFNPTSIAAAELSTKTCLVTMMSGGYELLHVRRALEIFADWEDRDERLRAIYTRFDDTRPGLRREIERETGFPVAGTVPNAYDVVSESADNGRMAVDFRPDTKFAQSISAIAQDMIRKARGRGK